MKKTASRFASIIRDELPLLFIIVSVLCIIVDPSLYSDSESYDALYLNSFINIAVTALYLVSMYFRRRIPVQGFIDSGMQLFIIYNLIPVILLLDIQVIQALSSFIVVLSASVFIRGNLRLDRIAGDRRLHRAESIIYSLILIVFSLIFLARGVINVHGFITGATTKPEFAVSVSDLIVCIVWMLEGLRALILIRKNDGNLVPVFFQAALLFLSLMAYLIINPMLMNQPLPAADITIIAAMSLFFIIPAILILRKSSMSAG